VRGSAAPLEAGAASAGAASAPIAAPHPALASNVRRDSAGIEYPRISLSEYIASVGVRQTDEPY
jgi:hypothetical protein